MVVFPVNLVNTEELEPGAYIARLLIHGSFEKIIKIILEIESLKVLYDVDVYVPEEFSIVKPGDDINFYLTLTNIGRSLTKDNVLVSYMVKDDENTIIFEDSESISVAGQKTIQKEIRLPSYSKLGDYVILATAKSEGFTAVSSAIVGVVDKEALSEESLLDNLFYILITTVMVICVIVLISLHLINTIRKRALFTQKKRKS